MKRQKSLIVGITVLVIAVLAWQLGSETDNKNQIYKEHEVESADHEITPANAPAKKTEMNSDLNNMSDQGVTTQTTTMTHNKSEAELLEAVMIKKGYVKDPNRPGWMFKKIIDKNGKEREHALNLAESFEPQNKTVKSAEETLQSKRNISPEEDFENLKKIDFNNDNDGLLSGRFKDNANNIEMWLTIQESEAAVCFMAPNHKVQHKAEGSKIQLNSDGTGYGVIKLNQSEYIRLTWSMETRRKIHGIYFNVASQNDFSFTLSEINHEELTLCK